MTDRVTATKWVLLLVAAGVMGAVGTYQFVWSSIRPAIGTRLGTSEQVLGSIFTVYVVCQTLSQFPAGWFRDRYGPRIPLAVGAVLITAGYAGTGYASEQSHVFLSYAVGGLGAGAAYTVAINTPVKWFDDRRGLATGVVATSYGAVSVLFIPSVRAGVGADFTATLLTLGAVTGGVALLGVFVLRDPSHSKEEARGSTGGNPTDAFTWRETIRTWQFWLLYLLLVVVNAVGLMIIGKAVSAAQYFGLEAVVATATASVLALADGAGVVVLSGLSDRFGRERTVATTVTVCGIAIALAAWAGVVQRGLLFIALLGTTAFFRSPIFAIAPSLVGEYYGPARSSENYAALYTAKVWGGVGGGLVASVLIGTIGWSRSFVVGAIAMIAIGLLTTRLRPVER